jgi:catechol 2,3-dioxygenase-like lactoylglutathione lyase family enzyme
MQRLVATRRNPVIKGLAHLCFIVKNLDRSVAFYRDKLGLKETFDFVNDKGVRFGVYLCAGGRAFFELFEGSKPPEPYKDDRSYQHFCLEVDDIEATAADLRAKGIEVSPVTLGSDNSYQAWLVDPDGNRIELHMYTPESKQARAFA